MILGKDQYFLSAPKYIICGSENLYCVIEMAKNLIHKYVKGSRGLEKF